MATNSIIEGCKQAGLTPGEGVRAALDGPAQDELALFDDDVAVIDRQFGVPQAGWSGGRKKGAKNRAPRDVIEYVRRAGTDPVIAMSKVASMSPAEVAKFTGMKRAAAMRFWLDCVKALKDTLYPGQTLAEIIRDMLGGDDAQVVMGWLVTAQLKPGEAGSAKPDLDGSMAANERAEIGSWSPEDEAKQNQALNGYEAAKVAQSEGRMDEVSD